MRVVVAVGDPNAVLQMGGERVLQMGSICIDAGLDASASFPDDDLSKDFLGAARPALAPDLGPTEAN